jgi:hypothetical protein
VCLSFIDCCPMWVGICAHRGQSDLLCYLLVEMDRLVAGKITHCGIPSTSTASRTGFSLCAVTLSCSPFP